MAHELGVDPVGLRLAGGHIPVAADQHAAEAANHLDDLADAASRWRGQSRAALHELADRWQAHDSAHHGRVTALGEKVCEAAQRFTAADGASGEAIGSTPIIGSKDGGGPVLDMGRCWTWACELWTS